MLGHGDVGGLDSLQELGALRGSLSSLEGAGAEHVDEGGDQGEADEGELEHGPYRSIVAPREYVHEPPAEWVITARHFDGSGSAITSCEATADVSAAAG